MKVYVHTWGCQMNVLDSLILEGRFAAAGHGFVDSPDKADVVILNTCSVREHVENKVFSMLGELKALKRRHRDLKIVVAGCMAERLGEELLRRFSQVDLVVGTRHMSDILPLLGEVGRQGRSAWTGGTYVWGPPRDITRRIKPWQAYVCAMRGCDNFCTYCIVPYVRGRQVSRPRREIVDEVKALADDGVREVTLLGQNVTAYGVDKGRPQALSHLLEALQEISGLEWIKFITCHPKDTGRDVFEAMRDLPKVCRYIHMPAQSGSDRVLRAMKRGYTRRDYLEKIRMLRDTVGAVSIAGDFIVGFPGETSDDFEATVSLLEEVGYKNSFIFRYSPRPGTAAEKLVDDVDLREKARRNTRLLEVQNKVSLVHNSGFIGQKMPVLVSGPSRKDPGMLSGRTEGEEIVIFDGPGELEGQFVEVEITAVSPSALLGILVSPGKGGGGAQERR